MSRSILYTHPAYIRTIVPECLVKYFKLNIDVLSIEDNMEKFNMEFPIKKLPAYIDVSGAKLTESVAIGTFLVKASGNKEEINNLVGPDSDILLQAEIIRWQSLSVSDFIASFIDYVSPYVKWAPYDEKAVQASKAKLDIYLGVYEKQLSENKYLAADHITLADLLSAGCFYFGFSTMFGTEYREKYPKITAWYLDVTASPYLTSFFDDKNLVENPLPTPSN